MVTADFGGARVRRPSARAGSPRLGPAFRFALDHHDVVDGHNVDGDARRGRAAGNGRTAGLLMRLPLSEICF